MSGHARMPGETTPSFAPDPASRTDAREIGCAAGDLRIVGGRTEQLLRGGWPNHPRVVEAPLRAHPAIDDVCANGVPGNAPGSLVGACIANHDLVRFFDALPTTGSGKVRRRELEPTMALDHTATTGT